MWSPGKCQLGAWGRSTRFESSSGASGALGSESSGADGSPPLNEPWGPQKEDNSFAQGHRGEAHMTVSIKSPKALGRLYDSLGVMSMRIGKLESAGAP